MSLDQTGTAAEQQDAADDVRAFAMAALAPDLGVLRTWDAFEVGARP